MNESPFRIKDWAEDDRPREKMMERGASALSDSELIAIVLRSGTPQENALQLSRRILSAVDNDLSRLCRMSPEEMVHQFKGIGPAKAVALLASLELGKRRMATPPAERPQLMSSKAIYQLMFPRLADLRHEECWVLLLNQANRLLKMHRVGQGGLSEAVADPRIILKLAVEALAVSLVVCHNHPSGRLQPSRADLDFTAKLRNAARAMDLRLIDHLIIGEGGYYSFADNNL